MRRDNETFDAPLPTAPNPHVTHTHAHTHTHTPHTHTHTHPHTHHKHIPIVRNQPNAKLVAYLLTMEAAELVMQWANHKQKEGQYCFMSKTGQVWSNTNKAGAMPTQSQMGISDQTHGRCRHPKYKALCQSKA